MEIMWRQPLFLLIGIPAAILILLAALLIRRGKTLFQKGARVSNTEMILSSERFRRAMRTRRILSGLAVALLFVAVMALLFLGARAYTSRTEVVGRTRRDIFLCLDFDVYMDDINERIFDNCIDIIRGMDGNDRIGVTIFSSTTLPLVPLTDDYEYAIRKIEELKAFFQACYRLDQVYTREYGYWNAVPDSLAEAAQADYDLYDRIRERYWGPLETNYPENGIYLASDGLAGCLLQFPRVFEEEKRSRIILFSSAAVEYAGYNPVFTMEEAAALCAERGVKVFSLFRGEEAIANAYGYAGFFNNVTIYNDYEDSRAQMMTAAEMTGGRFYEMGVSLSVEDVMRDIRAHEAMRIEDITETRETEYPEIPLMVLFFAVIGYLVAVIRVKA